MLLASTLLWPGQAWALGGPCTVDTSTFPGTAMFNCSGLVSTSGSSEPGILAFDALNPYTHIQVTSSAEVWTSGEFSDGIEASSTFGTVSIQSNGNVATSGFRSSGMTAWVSEGSSDIESSGVVTTSGFDAQGLRASSNSGNAAATFEGTISTTGIGSTGISVFSMNGHSGIEVSGSVSTTGELASAVSAEAIDGGANILSSATITTNGERSNGIAAYAVHGDVSVEASGSITTTGKMSRGIEVTAPQAGHAEVDSSATISTSGERSSGIYVVAAQNNARITSSGDVKTSGRSADALHAESEEGNISIESTGALATSGDYAAAILATADGGNVDIKSSGAIETAGRSAHGILGMSRGELAAVEISSSSDIYTAGDGANGIHASSSKGRVSIDASGILTIHDASGISASADKEALVASSAEIKTLGPNSAGIRVSAISGRAWVDSTGNITMGGGYSMAISASSSLGTTDVFASGTISGVGDWSQGLFASSSSGSAIVGSTADITLNGDYSTAIDARSGGEGISVRSSGDLSIEGFGARGISASASEDGTNVKLKSSSDIRIRGESGSAIFAHNRHGTVAIDTSGSLTLEGPISSGVQALADTVTITSSSAISMLGSQSSAFDVTAITGDARIDSSGDITMAGYGSRAIGVGSNDGKVTIYASGTITGTGAESQGLSASSENGNALVESVADIDLSGDESTAIEVTSGNGLAEVDVSGVVRVSGEDSVGIYATGANVVISNAGNLIVDDGTAILVGPATTAGIDNFGLVRGMIESQASNTEIDNQEGGVIESNWIGLNGGVFTNMGTFSIDGVGHVEGTELNGDYVQDATGIFLVDANWASGSADQIQGTKTGGTANLAGQVAVNLMNVSATAGRSKTFTIIKMSDGAIIDNGITVTDTVIIDYELAQPDAKNLNLTATLDFRGTSGDGTAAQQAMGAHLNSIVEAGSGPELGIIATLLAVKSEEELFAALDAMQPASGAPGNSSALASGSAFAGQMLSCRVAGTPEEAFAAIREGQCLWARAGARRTTSDAGAGGYDETAAVYAAGAQVDIGGPWRIGAAIGYEDLSSGIGGSTNSEGDRLQVGGIVKYNPGPLLLAASVTGGRGWLDTTRMAVAPGIAALLTSDSTTDVISGRLSAAYLVQLSPTLTLKPQIEAAATRIDRGAYVESGPVGLALAVEGSSDTVLSVSPSLELAGDLRLNDGGVVRPYVKAGVTWLDTDDFTTSASLAGVGGAPFDVTSEVDDLTADIGAGLDIITASGVTLRLQYDGRFGDHTQQNSGSAKVSVPF